MKIKKIFNIYNIIDIYNNLKNYVEINNKYLDFTEINNIKNINIICLDDNVLDMLPIDILGKVYVNSIFMEKNDLFIDTNIMQCIIYLPNNPIIEINIMLKDTEYIGENLTLKDELNNIEIKKKIL